MSAAISCVRQNSCSDIDLDEFLKEDEDGE